MTKLVISLALMTSMACSQAEASIVSFARSQNNPLISGNGLFPAYYGHGGFSTEAPSEFRAENPYAYYLGMEILNGALLCRPAGYVDVRYPSEFIFSNSVAALPSGAFIGSALHASMEWRTGQQLLSAFNPNPLEEGRLPPYWGEHLSTSRTDILFPGEDPETCGSDCEGADYVPPTYAGFYIDAADGRHYGWIWFNGSVGVPIYQSQIHAIGVETTPWLPILAGSRVSIPEPMSFSALALGCGLWLRRRR